MSRYPLLYLLFFVLFIVVSCTNSSSETSQIDDTTDSLPDSTIVEAVENKPPPPPPDAVKDSITTVYTEKSPFLSLGCCEDKAKRRSKCCCEAVLEAYKKMYEKEDPKLSDYKTTDPILGACRRKMQDAFDLVENPPPKEGEKVNYDDLF